MAGRAREDAREVCLGGSGLGSLAEGSKSILRVPQPGVIHALVLLFVTLWEVIKRKIYSFLSLGGIACEPSSLGQATAAIVPSVCTHMSKTGWI